MAQSVSNAIEYQVTKLVNEQLVTFHQTISSLEILTKTRNMETNDLRTKLEQLEALVKEKSPGMLHMGHTVRSVHKPNAPSILKVANVV